MNVLVGGLVALTTATLDGRPGWKPVLGGAAGGAVMFLGKRLTTSNSNAMGFVGREVSAVGASVARNAALGSPPLDTIVLPLGPVWFEWSTIGLRPTSVRLDLEALAWTSYQLADDRYRVDWGRTVRAGAFVFTASDLGWSTDGTVAGKTRGGTVALSESELRFRPRNLHHELVHVAQIDYLKIAFGDPLEAWLLSKLDWPSSAVREHVRVSVLHYPAQALFKPWLEDEASRFEARYSSR